jgi:hypothetical protein
LPRKLLAPHTQTHPQPSFYPLSPVEGEFQSYGCE